MSYVPYKQPKLSGSGSSSSSYDLESKNLVAKGLTTPNAGISGGAHFEIIVHVSFPVIFVSG
jgi:hypothetical protein